jgi:hypothetical protein
MSSVFNLEPKYRICMLTREKWTRGPGTFPVVTGLFWYTDGSGTRSGTRAGIFGQCSVRRLSMSLGMCATVL